MMKRGYGKGKGKDIKGVQPNSEITSFSVPFPGTQEELQPFWAIEVRPKTNL